MIDTNTYLTNLSSRLIVEPNLKGKIETSIGFLKEKIWGLFQDKLDMVYTFGSYDRETFIASDKESDVDILVVFKEKQLQPDTYLKKIKEFCEHQYSRSEIYQDHPTIVIEMEHVKFEIVPSYHAYENTVKIPAPRSKEVKWISTSPQEFKERLIKKDTNNKKLILPLIRIIKHWNSINDKPFTSFELEQHIISKIYDFVNLRDYYYSASNSLETIANDENKRSKVAKLKERNRRLRTLENNRIPEYIESELSSFLPLP